MNKILITDDTHPSLAERLIQLGYMVDNEPTIERSAVLERIDQFTGLLINSRIMADRELLQKATQLRFVARIGSGLEVIDQVYAQGRGIAVINAPEGNRNAVGEHALGMLLCFANNISRADAQIKSWTWKREENRGFEIKNKTIGIIGFGQNGSAFAEKLEGFNVKILSFDKFRQRYAQNFRNVIETDLNTLVENADIISLHVPLNDDTYHMVDEKFLRRCKEGVILVNTSRGKVVDQMALVRALESGKVSGACLDVFENEKLITFSEEEKVWFQRLINTEKVVFTPHVAGWTIESRKLIADVLFAKINELSAI